MSFDLGSGCWIILSQRLFWEGNFLGVSLLVIEVTSLEEESEEIREFLGFLELGITFFDV